ncbi:MAG: DUF2935 domain-containing protein [Tissierellaceae bacterium]|nr:DUF2935 domain-containing protein [Tissierellaceae bacterium]
MLSRPEFIKKSLEVNLFFLRIMKEHLIFLEANLSPVNVELKREADILKRSLEMLLNETVSLAFGAVRKEVLESNELVTPYTLDAEETTSKLTGISIDTSITNREMDLYSNPNFDYTPILERQLDNINCRARNLVEDVVDLKSRVLNQILECNVFATMYPEMLEHIIEEAELYLETLEALLDHELPEKALCDQLNFWNHIMGEHAEFIDGLLDPSEKDLKSRAERFIKIYEMLVEDCIRCSRRYIIDKSTKTTKDFRDYKTAAVEGILDCEIRSIIPPLLADHVLREANHYLRMLRELKI